MKTLPSKHDRTTAGLGALREILFTLCWERDGNAIASFEPFSTKRHGLRWDIRSTPPNNLPDFLNTRLGEIFLSSSKRWKNCHRFDHRVCESEGQVKRGRQQDTITITRYIILFAPYPRIIKLFPWQQFSVFWTPII